MVGFLGPEARQKQIQEAKDMGLFLTPALMEYFDTRMRPEDPSNRNFLREIAKLAYLTPFILLSVPEFIWTLGQYAKNDIKKALRPK